MTAIAMMKLMLLLVVMMATVFAIVFAVCVGENAEQVVHL